MAVTNLAEQERLRKEAEERQKRKYERSKGTNNNEAKAITRTYRTEDVDREENQGGFFGGAAYLGEKLAAGFVQSIEGMADYIGGGFLKFLGDVTGNVDLQDQAYDIFNEQWWNGDFYRHADEWYNPSGGMKVAGDIAGGIGTSLPAIAGATIATVASHGAAAPAAWAKAAPVIGAAFAGVGAAGNATSEAVQETGSLDWSKLGYGAMVGATEAVVEHLTAGIGAGSGRILKELAQTGMGKAVSQFTKKGLVNIAKQVGKDFAAEAAEEMIAEFTAPIYKRMTYDPNAKMASAEQIAYVGFVGGMSGVIMSGGQSMVNTGRNSVVGKQIIRNGEVDRVLAMGKRLSEFKSANPDIESETLNAAVETYEKLSASKAKDANFFRNRYQANKLGELAMLDTAVTFEMYAAQRAYDIAMNADAFVEKASAYKYVDPDGNPITVTKDELLKGVKVGKDGSIDRKSLVKAIRTNRTLQYFALMDVAGHMAMDTSAFTEASKQGQGVATDLDLARYLETASDTEKSSLARALGVDGVAGLEALSADEFNSRVAWRNENSARVKDLNSIAQIADSVKDVAAEGAIPSRFRRRNDGTYLYESDGNKIAIVKQGDSYGVYDYKTGKVASKLTKGELDQMLKDYNERHGRRESADATTETKTATKAETADTKNAEVEAFANERVKGYSKLLPAEKTLVRRVIRQGRTMGVRDDILSAYANVCAHAKILVQFRKGVGMEVKTASGEVVKSNGYYDEARNVIVANPDATNGIDRVLIHELDHAIRTSEPKRGKAGKAKTFSEAIRGVAEDVKANIKATYGKDVETIKDEINAYYAETVLSAEATVERLVADRPSLKDKILGFFKAAKADYKDVPFLDKAAESYYQKYKKMFDKFAKRNAGGLISSVSERNVRAIRPSNALGVKHNLAFVETHRKKLENNYNGYDLKEYDLAVEMFKGISEEMDSAFLSEWNDKDGKRKPFKVFKDQMGYKHNVELSTECVKGVALFEAIDSIVQKQISKTVGDAGIHTAEKQLLYDLLQKRGFQIPCAICYVEQARQREGKIIENFLDGNEEKLGWNQTIDKIEKLMAADGHAYTFGNFNRMLATDAYSPAKAADMTDEQFEAFNKAFRTLANEYIDRENERRAQTNKKLLPRINSVTPSSVSKSLPATANLDIKLLRTFFLDPSLRMRIADDLLYSSLTTLNLATHHQKLYALFNQQGGQQTYKLKQAPIVYWGEILGKKKTPKDIRTEGSFRIQSNSDFQLYSFLDYVQMFVDLSAKGYSLHAYTKTLTQLKLFGLSGGKINASLIPRVKVYYDADGNVNEAKTMENAGLDESGNPIYDDVEGIPHEETFMLLEDPEYSKNCTGICIGYSDKHILKLLDDPHVQLIIGFHDTTNDTSKRYRGAKYSTNYNGFNEAVKVVSKDKFETVHLSFNEFVMQAEAALGYNVDTRKAKKESVEYNGKTYKVDDIPRLAVAMYLQYCSDHNMLPAYSRTGIDFSKHPNYYKLLGDYGLYDSQGHYAPQGAVSYKLPSKVPYLDANGKKAYQSTKAYLKEHLQGELAVRDSLAATLAEEGEGSFMDEYTNGAKAIRENGGRYAPKVEPQVNAPTISIVPANARKSLPISAHATAAVEEFGTTGEFRKAGFVLPDGRMLNLSPNGIGVNHKQIERVMDVKGEAAVAAFINEGNVRIKADAPGIEIGTESDLTVSQINALAPFISRALRERGMLYLDITDPDAKTVASTEYEKGGYVSTEGILWDIRDYYGRGTIPDGRKYSLPIDGDAYSYDTLTKKSDLSVVNFPTELPMTEKGEVDTNAVVARGRLNARKQKNPNNTDERTYVHVGDIGLDVLLSKKGMVHGIARSRETAFAVMKIGDVLKNSVAVNELNGSAKRKTKMSYVLLGACRDSENLYAVRSVVSKLENDVTEIDVYQLSAVKGKKTETPTSALGGTGVKEQNALVSSESPTISIADFLEYVKTIPLSNEVFSEDVAKKIGVERTKGTLSRDIRYSLPLGTTDGDFDPRAVLDKGTPRATGKANMTVAQLARVLANNTRMKVFSRQEALKIVNNFSASDLLTEKTRNELATQVWTLLNDAPDPDYREASIRNMAEFIAARIMTEAKYDNRNPDAVEDASYTVSNLHTYVQRVTFSDAYRQEIKSKVGEDGWRSIVSRWSLKKRFGAGTPMDVAMWDIVSEVKGFEGLEEMHPADAFIEIDKRYREALSDLQKDDITLWETMDDAQAEAFVEGIARDIRDAFENGGSKSKLANILNNNIGYYKARAEKLRSELVEQNQFQRAVNDIQYLCDRLKNIKAGALDNATQNKDHPFAATLESLANVKWRGRMLSPKTIREHLTQLHFWYVSDTTKKILGYKSEEDTGMYSQYIADVMAKIASPAPRESTSLKTDNTPFTAYDLERIKEVISHAIAISENYNKVWKNGKLVDALPEAEKYIETMQKSLSVKVNATWEKVYSGYLWQFGTPVDVMAHADKFMEGGFFSEMLQTLRDAAENAAIEEMNVLKEHDAFIDKHKHYVRESTETKVKFRGQEIPKQTLITLYMTAKREHAWAGLVFNGAQYKLGNLEVKVKPLTTAEELTYGEMQSLMAQAQEEMAALLTETDKEYIAILEKGYNLTLKEIKIKRDMERMGFTNAMDGYYIPLKRANMATTIDQQFLPINTASNSSFNKNTVKGAAQALELVAAEDLFLRHAHEVCQYAYLSPAIESFDVLWNIDTAGNRNNPTSLKTVYHAANPDVVADRKSEKRENAKRGDMEGYFRELIQDIQGTKRGDSNEWISAIRGGYATFQLGANPKVWMTQLSSIFASLSELDAQSVFGIGGINFFSPAGSDVDLYCPLAELRNYNNDAASAQAVMDMRTNRASEGLQKVRDVSMTMIGKMDRLVVMKVFIACQKHVAKHQGLEYGTEANKIAAGKLLKTVIENTQQGSLATEKSKAARGGEIMKTFTMFRSDAIKVMGRVLTSAGNLAVKIQVAKSMKANPNAYSKEQIAKAEADVKAAGMKFGKSMAALVSVSAFMTFVSWLFRHLYNKDEDKPEEELLKTAITFGGSFLGGLPIISDIYSSIVEGFAIENFALGAANDLVEAIKGVGTLIVNSAQSKASSQDWMRGTRDIVYAVCSIMGLPVRNVWNTVSGLIRRVNSGAGKAIDNVFYGTYASEFKEAIEAGDDSKAYMIMQILTGDRLDGADSAVVNGFHSLNQRLLKQNKDIILPADCPASITVGGKKIEFTTAEQAKIQQRFASKAESDFKKLFASEAYKSMTAAQKRAAVAAINSARLHECIEYATNKDTGDSNILGAKAVTFSTFAQYKGIINGIESDKDKDGNTISGSKRAKVVAAIKKLKVSDEQKLFLIMVSGYSVKAGDFAGISEKSAKKRVASFIAGLSSLTKAEKEELAKKCGFEVKNGVIQTK